MFYDRMIIIASIHATDMEAVAVGGGEKIILFVGFKKWISVESHQRKKTQRQFEDEPTPGENDLLVLVIKF